VGPGCRKAAVNGVILWGASRFIESQCFERTRDGIAAARARGKVPGRPTLDIDKLASALKLIEAGVRPAQAAKQLGLGRSTLYRELALIRQSAPDTPALEGAA
jgi:DNA invertase Pin-like site-specific DNA recombinase